ncbi:hypothetical protein BH10ACT8_BH10ACT8_02390 [soil metagenome]|jgi:hypothetical protein
MTVFQLNRSPSASLVAAPTRTAAVLERPGRHACELRARLSLRRLFYVARHGLR